MKRDTDDYPASSLLYVVLASVSVAIVGLALALLWGHHISHLILRGGM